MIRGWRWARQRSGAGDLFAHHGAHAAADEFRLHHADLDGVAGQAANGGDERIGQVSGCLHGKQTLAVGLGVDKAQRVGGTEAGVELLVLAIVQQHLQAGEGVNSGVPAALGADVPIGLEVLFPHDLAAALALLPQTLGAHAALAVGHLGKFFIGLFVASEPSHAMIHVSAGRDGPARPQMRGRSVRPAWRAPIRAEKSWRKGRAEGRRGPPSREAGRHGHLPKRAGRGLPFQPAR